MIAVSIQKLTRAVRETDIFHFPAMNTGTEYLYNHLYKRLLADGYVTLSGLDFAAFDSEDIGALNDLHSKVFERNSYTSNEVISILQAISPVCKSVIYV